MKGGTERKPSGHQATPVLADSALAAARTQPPVLSSAPGHCTHSAWEKHHALFLSLPSSPSSHSWKQAWEKVQDHEQAENRVEQRYGTTNINYSGAVRHFLCLGWVFLLGPSSSLAVEMLGSTCGDFLQGRKDAKKWTFFFTQCTLQAQGESIEGLSTKINVWPAALSRTCSFKTGQWLGRIGGYDLSNAAAVLLTEGDK